MPEEFQFHVGYYDNLHPEPSINFQMNRWINYLGASALDCKRSLPGLQISRPTCGSS